MFIENLSTQCLNTLFTYEYIVSNTRFLIKLLKSRSWHFIQLVSKFFWAYTLINSYQKNYDNSIFEPQTRQFLCTQ